MTAPESVKRLVGFDTAGETFLSGERVLRGIYPGDAGTIRDILAVCEREELFSHGIVATRELLDDPHPELGYEIVLEHERIPFISYPHEWCASMLRDAALFHIDLFQRLAAIGLTLKDWHPYNVLFDGATPTFVDFGSIIPIGTLADQPHLVQRPEQKGLWKLWDTASDATYESYRGMYEPFFGLPLEMMKAGRHAEARRRLYETALNSSEDVITRHEAFAGNLTGRLAYAVADRRLKAALLEKGPVKRRFFRLIRKMLSSSQVSVNESAYSSYYEDKGEAFPTEPSSQWTAKQRSVHAALTEFRPATVLDLGCNTGWFSKLAARLGSSVVAVDLDEASIDTLYNSVKADDLSILPLVANLTSPVADRPARVFPNEPSLTRIGGNEPLYSAPAARLQCEMVMALALVHHLALGQGLSFEHIAGIFAGLAKKYLCAEFVAIDDAMITGDRPFFPRYDADPNSFEWYTLENFVTALRPHFSTVEIRPSYPNTRSMVILSR